MDRFVCVLRINTNFQQCVSIAGVSNLSALEIPHLSSQILCVKNCFIFQDLFMIYEEFFLNCKSKFNCFGSHSAVMRRCICTSGSTHIIVSQQERAISISDRLGDIVLLEERLRISFVLINFDIAYILNYYSQRERNLTRVCSL